MTKDDDSILLDDISYKKVVVKRGVLAKIIGCTDRHINKLEGDGVITKAGRGRYNLAECMEQYNAWNQSSSKKYDSSVTGGRAEKLESEAKLKKAQASKAERLNAAAERELMIADGALQGVRGFCLHVSRILEVIPHRLRRRFPDSLDDSVIKAIDDEIIKIQNIASNVRLSSDEKSLYLDKTDELVIAELNEDLDDEIA